jgi:Zn finger protein HypA/HybF involved in hydrogenase expression
MPKKNNLPETDAVVIDREILRKAKLAAETERPKSASRCEICNAEASPNSTENLCWVCRRLKISAWRDSDQQVSAQE